MSTIDIRTTDESPVNKVVFANKDSGTAHAVSVEVDLCGDKGRIRINGQNSSSMSDYLYVNGKEEAEDLIKAIKFGIDAGWVS